MTLKRDVVVTGLGVITPIGLNVSELLSNVLANRSGIRLWESPLLSKPLPAGLIERDFSDQFTKLELPYLDRCSQMAILAADQACADAGIEYFDGFAGRAGLFYGSVGGGVKVEHDWVEQFHAQRKQLAKPFTIMACMLNAASAQISIRRKILGPVNTHSSACTSSGAAIGDGFRAIRDGYLDIALVGGAEASLIPTFMALWGGLRALADPDPNGVGRSCRPFSRDRSGLVLGEGAVFLILESDGHARQRGVTGYCSLSGYGMASDGYHIGSPKQEGQVAAIRNAMDDAGLAAGDFDYFNAHATATLGGDPVEASAIRETLPEVPVSATKSIHGHLLGAASAIELAITILALNTGFLPATAFLDEVDPTCELHHVANRPVVGHQIRHAMSLSAGFGGTNVALAISRLSGLPGKTILFKNS